MVSAGSANTFRFAWQEGERRVGGRGGLGVMARWGYECMMVNLVLNAR
jgi:hypothetical protein